MLKMIGSEENLILTHWLNAGLYQKSIMKTELKNVLTVTLTEAKKTVKIMSDKQIANMVEKLNKLSAIVIAESNKRFEAKLEEEADAEIEDTEDLIVTDGTEDEESESDEV